MKIEMGESLCLSYLKHVKKCVIYQTNWKYSSHWEAFNQEFVEDIFNKIKEHELFNYIFKNSKNYSQVIKQAEIDVIGIDQGKKVYALDIAYHEQGLNYGDTQETVNRLLKKMIRSYMALISYFPGREYEIIFASPKVNPAIESAFLNSFDKLKNIFATERVIFRYISNEKFAKEILYKTIDESKTDSDISELFIRSYRLLKLFENKKN